MKQIHATNAAEEKERRANRKGSPKRLPIRPQRPIKPTNTNDAALPDQHVIVCPTVEIKKSVKDVISLILRTRRKNGKLQASVCVVCDRCIIGVEKTHALTKERILLNAKRPSVETYEEFCGEMLHPILVNQYQIDDIKGILLSPRSFRGGDTFECCSACFSSLKPSQVKKNTKPPKNAIANRYAIGHIPEVTMMEGEDSSRQVITVITADRKSVVITVRLLR